MKKLIPIAGCALMALLAAPGFSQSINIVSPTGGQTFNGDDSVVISWTADAALKRFWVQYSLSGGTSWATIPVKDTAAKSLTWYIPYLKSTCSNVIVRVLANNSGTQVTDVSDAPFTINKVSHVDPYEPNDESSAAHAVPLDSTLTGAMVFGGFTDTFNTANNELYIDQDFFKFTLTAPGLVTIRTIPEYSPQTNSFNRLNLPLLYELSDAAQNRVSYHSTSQVTYHAQKPGTFVMRVYSGSWCKYGLNVSVAPFTARETRTFDTSTVQKVTDSTYYVSVGSDTTNMIVGITLDHKTGGSVSMALVNPDDLSAAADSAGNFKTVSIVADPPMMQAFKSAVIALPYDPETLGSGATEKSISAMWFDDTLGKWKPVDFDIDTAENSVMISATRLSLFGLFAASAVAVAAPVKPMPRIGLRAAFTNNRLTINISGVSPSAGQGVVRLYTVAGKLAGESVIEKSMQSIDCGNLANGIYLVTATIGIRQVRTAVNIVR